MNMKTVQITDAAFEKLQELAAHHSGGDLTLAFDRIIGVQPRRRAYEDLKPKVELEVAGHLGLRADSSKENLVAILGQLQELQPLRFRSVLGLRWPEKEVVAISDRKENFASAKHQSLVEQIGSTGIWVYCGYPGKELKQLLIAVMSLMGYPKSEISSLTRYISPKSNLHLFAAELESLE